MLTSETRINEALADGVTRAWPFTFKVFAASHLRLQVRDDDESDWTEVSSADFTVTLVADTTEPGAFSGGTVTYPKSPVAVLVAPAELRILREVPYTQTEIRLRNTSGWNPLSVEQEFDRIAMRHQQLRDELLVFAGEIVVVVGPQGEQGETGEDGPQGDRGDIGRPNLFLGTVDDLEDLPELGEDGNNYLYDNAGTMEIWSWITSEWVLTGEIPPGPAGAAGGDGEDGVDGAGIAIAGTVATYAELPGDLTGDDAGDAYFVEADGLLYVWDSTAFQAEGEGIEFRGPSGEPGAPGTDAYIPNAETFNSVGDARYTRRANNLSDLTSVPTARTNLVVAEKQSTTSDTTAGRGLIVGGFGLGGITCIAVPGADADDIDATGYYAVVSATANIPLAAGGVLHHIALRTPTEAQRRATQRLVYTGAGVVGRTYQRTLAAVGWSDWIETDSRLALAAGYIVDADRTGDDSASEAIQDQIDLASAAGGGTVIIPPGTYRITDTVMMASNVHVECQHGAIFIVEDLPTSGVTIGQAIRFAGTSAPVASSGVALSAVASSGSTLIQTAASHGLVVGDLVRIVGQRNAFSVDAGRWRLGVGTVSLQVAHFQEFAQVRDINSSTSFNIDRALVFPDYNPDDSDETDPDALAAAKAIKYEPMVNARWSGGKFLTRDANTLVAVASMSICKDCIVEDIEDDRGLTMGWAVTMALSWHCRARNIVSYHSPGLEPDYDTHHNATGYVLVAACAECVVEGGYAYGHAQSIDFTYSGTHNFVCYRCTVEGVTVENAMEQAFTSHPGVYGSLIRNNRFVNCRRGAMALRGVAERIVGNECTSYQWNIAQTLEGEVPSPAGVLLTNGAGLNTVIDSNRFDGFGYGIHIRDSSALYYDRLGMTISNNSFNNVWRGVQTTISAVYQYGGRRDLWIDGNVFENVEDRCININNYMAGVAITDNTFRGPYNDLVGDANARFVDLSENCPGFLIENNRIFGMEDDPSSGRVVIRAGTISDTTTFPSGTWEGKGRVRNNFGLDLLNFSISTSPYTLITGTAS